MTLQKIREQIEKRGLGRATLKDALCDWLAHGCEVKFDIGLTIMPRKVFYKHISARRGFKQTEIYRNLSKEELIQSSKRYVELLNRLVYKQAYKRYNVRLDVIMTIEGERELKDLHTHFSISKPETIGTNEFARLVRQALEMSGEFEIVNPNYRSGIDALDKQYRYKVDIIDSDWGRYITKKLDNKSFNNFYFI